MLIREDFGKIRPTEDDQNQYVGIEIECIGNHLTRHYLSKRLWSLIRANKIDIGQDSSIDFDETNEEGIEIRIIDTEQNILKTLKIVMLAIKRSGAIVDNSCGIHIHLDMRHRVPESIYRNLYRSLPILYKKIKLERKISQYCVRNQYSDYLAEVGVAQKYKAININNFVNGSKDTFEIRLHHATLNYNSLANWVKLLIKIVNHKKDLPPDIDNTKQYASILKLDNHLRHYLMKKRVV